MWFFCNLDEVFVGREVEGANHRTTSERRDENISKTGKKSCQCIFVMSVHEDLLLGQDVVNMYIPRPIIITEVDDEENIIKEHTVMMPKTSQHRGKRANEDEKATKKIKSKEIRTGVVLRSAGNRARDTRGRCKRSVSQIEDASTQKKTLKKAKKTRF